MNPTAPALDHLAVWRLLERLDPGLDGECCVPGCIHCVAVVDHAACMLSSVA